MTRPGGATISAPPQAARRTRAPPLRRASAAAGRAEAPGHAQGVVPHVRPEVERPIAGTQDPVEQGVLLLIGEEAAAADLGAKEEAPALGLGAGGEGRV